MSTEKYKVFNDGGLQALVNQTRANKIAAGDNSAAIDGISTDLQQLGTQVAGVLGEVENCLNELDTVKADTEAVEKALSGKSDTGHTHNYAGSSSAGGAATSAEKLNTSAGSENTPVYFKDGKPVECSISLDADIDCGTF